MLHWRSCASCILSSWKALLRRPVEFYGLQTAVPLGSRLSDAQEYLRLSAVTKYCFPTVAACPRPATRFVRTRFRMFPHRIADLASTPTVDCGIREPICPALATHHRAPLVVIDSGIPLLSVRVLPPHEPAQTQQHCRPGWNWTQLRYQNCTQSRTSRHTQRHSLAAHPRSATRCAQPTRDGRNTQEGLPCRIMDHVGLRDYPYSRWGTL